MSEENKKEPILDVAEKSEYEMVAKNHVRWKNNPVGQVCSRQIEGGVPYLQVYQAEVRPGLWTQLALHSRQGLP